MTSLFIFAIICAATLHALPTPDTEGVAIERIFSDSIVPETTLPEIAADAVGDYDHETSGDYDHGTGPTFFSGHNFKGSHWSPGLSVPDVDLSEHIESADISSIRIPFGWCATLYTKRNFMGESTRMCGLLNQASLVDVPLVKHHHDSTAEDKTYTTNWDNVAQSLTVEKFQYAAIQPKQKCVTSCGVQGHHFTGSVSCLRSHGLVPRHAVDESFCAQTGITPPESPIRLCPATQVCAEFKTSAPVKNCPKSCGFAGSTVHGRVWCSTRDRSASDGDLPEEVQPASVAVGATVSDNVCTGLGEFKPIALASDCDAMPACVEYVTMGPAQLGAKCPVHCGEDPSVLQGAVMCEETETGKHVSDIFCDWWKHNKPVAPTQQCKATEPCVAYMPVPPKKLGKTCPTKCGRPASTITGSVICVEIVSHNKVDKKACVSAGLPEPDAPTDDCAAQAPCLAWVKGHPTSKCPTGCGSAATSLYGTVFCGEKYSPDTLHHDAECTKENGPKPKGHEVKCISTPACPLPPPVPVLSTPTVVHHTATNYHWVPKWPKELGKTCTSKCGASASVLAGSVVCTDVDVGKPVANELCSATDKPKTPMVDCSAIFGVGKCDCQIKDKNGACTGYGANAPAGFCNMNNKRECVDKQNIYEQYPCRWTVTCAGRCDCEKTDSRGACAGYGADAEPGFCNSEMKTDCLAKTNKLGLSPCRWKKTGGSSGKAASAVVKEITAIEDDQPHMMKKIDDIDNNLKPLLKSDIQAALANGYDVDMVPITAHSRQ